MPYPTGAPATAGPIPQEVDGPNIRTRRRVLPSRTAIADADGVATVAFQLPQNRTWMLEALTLRAYTSSSTVVTSMYNGEARDEDLIDALTSALGIGEYNPARVITDALVIEWTNLDPGDQCVASRVQIIESPGVL